MTQFEQFKACLPAEVKIPRYGRVPVKDVLTVEEAEAQGFNFRGATPDTVLLVLDRGPGLTDAFKAETLDRLSF